MGAEDFVMYLMLFPPKGLGVTSSKPPSFFSSDFWFGSVLKVIFQARQGLFSELKNEGMIFYDPFTRYI